MVLHCSRRRNNASTLCSTSSGLASGRLDSEIEAIIFQQTTLTQRRQPARLESNKDADPPYEARVHRKSLIISSYYLHTFVGRRSSDHHSSAPSCKWGSEYAQLCT